VKITFSQAVSTGPVRLFQLTVVTMVLLVLVLDGMDAQALGLVVPSIIAEWGVDRAEFGTSLTASLLGAGIGALLGGWLGDRFGRVTMLFASALFFGATTMASSQADTIETLAALRLLGGLGFGAAGPNGVALASEWTPERFRTHVIALLSVGTPGGGTIAAGIAPFLLDDFGWRGLFLIFGGASILIGFLALLLVRETPSWLLAKGREDAANRTARRIFGQEIELLPEPDGIIGTTGAEGTRVGLFHRDHTRLTAGVAIAFSACTAIVYGLTLWGVVLFTSRGFTQDQAIGVIFWAGLMSVAGALAGGPVVRILGSRRTMAACSAITFAAVVILFLMVEHLSAAPDGATLAAVYVLAGIMGGVASLGISTIYTMMALGYPVSCRSTGIGLGMLLGRIGGIAMALSGGYLLNWGGTSVLPFFGVMAACALAVSSSTWIIDRHIAPAREQ